MCKPHHEKLHNIYGQRYSNIKAAKVLNDCTSEVELLEQCHKLYFKQYGKFAKQELLIQIGQARILHHQDSQMLMMYDMTYNPYDIFNITQEVQELWEDVASVKKKKTA